jgi:ParB family chromosome partitioning protein
MLDVDAIDPDPEQPRKQDNPGFSENPLRSWLIPLKRVV